jgi:hypothetical protein
MTMVKRFIDFRGGTKGFAISSIILGDNMKLKIDADVTLLEFSEGHLSIDAMDFFRLWFMHKCFPFYDLYITHPHMWEIVKN